jgi:hypothetical protein
MIINKKNLFLGALLAFLALPFITEGAIPDFMLASVTTLTEIFGTILGLWLFSVAVLSIGISLLYMSVAFLEWIIFASPDLLTVTGENVIAEVVKIGWTFSVGMVNMVLLLFFLFIAIATIFGSEKYHLQKTFSRIIIVALLSNFTLLFVGAGIDISNFLFNSIAQNFFTEGGNTLMEVINPLQGFGLQIIFMFLTTLGGLALKIVIPFGELVIMVANIVSFFFLLPTIISNILMGAIMIMLAGVFITFFAILLSRIFLIQILAILAPVALLCSALDNTEKYWKLWLNTLIHWLLIGVMLIFFLYLGSAFIPLILITSQFTQSTDAPFLVKYLLQPFLPSLILFLYLLTVIVVVRKSTPQLATAAINAATKASPYLRATGKGVVAGTKGFAKSVMNVRDSAEGKRTFLAGNWGKGTGTLSKTVNLSRGLRDRALEEIEKKKVEDIEDNTKKRTPGEIGAAFSSTNDLHRQLGLIFHALSKNLVGSISEIRDVSIEKYQELYTKAERIGREKDLAKALPVHHGVANNIPPEKTLIDIIGKGDGMKNFTKQSNSLSAHADPKIQEYHEKIEKAMFKYSDSTYAEKHCQNANYDDRIRIQSRYTELEKKAEIHPNFKETLDRDPGGALFLKK